MLDKVEALSLNKRLVLTIPIQAVFLPVVTNFVEKGSLAFGLGKPETLKLTLAAEEIFAYLSRMANTDENMEITCMGGVYYGAVEFSFNKVGFNMRAFNVTSKVFPESEEGLEEMGLLIAARSVDHLQIAERSGERVVLRLIKEKEYPLDSDIRVPEIPYMASFSIKTPTTEEVKLFINLLNFHYEKYLFPPSFKTPGKVADMVFSGEYGASVAVDHRGLTGGGILWRKLGEKTVECYGPYLFGQGDNPKLAESLLDSFLGKIAKADITGIFSMYSTPHLSQGYFERLGTLTLFRKDGSSTELSSFYRHLVEDTGSYVWSSERLRTFLEEQYTKLVLPREIRLARYQGEHQDPHSVFTSEFDKELDEVTLRALWPGSDAFENLERHIRIFREEGLLNILFEMDLGIPWQADLTDPLFNLGFKPRFIIPYGGNSDLVIFQMPI